MPMGQAQAQQYGLQAPSMRDDLLNMLQGADPTMGLLSKMLPQPKQQNPALQLLMGAITPGIPGSWLKAGTKGVEGVFRSIDDMWKIVRSLDNASLGKMLQHNPPTGISQLELATQTAPVMLAETEAAARLFRTKPGTPERLQQVTEIGLPDTAIYADNAELTDLMDKAMETYQSAMNYVQRARTPR